MLDQIVRRPENEFGDLSETISNPVIIEFKTT